MFAFASGSAALGGAWPHVRRAWHERRVARRLAHDPYMQREELNEYRLKIGDDLPSLDLYRLAASSLFVGAFTASPTWLAEHHLERWWLLGWFAFCALTIAANVWRRLNDPPEMHVETGMPEVTVPREAWLGLAGGIAAVALILLLIAVLV
jgi:hypothetical protein